VGEKKLLSRTINTLKTMADAQVKVPSRCNSLAVHQVQFAYMLVCQALHSWDSAVKCRSIFAGPGRSVGMHPPHCRGTWASLTLVCFGAVLGTN
jgi:hypothetical protein